MLGPELLRVEGLTLHFRTSRGIVQAVDDVTFAIGSNEAVVVLGESGCGKSSLAKAVLRLLPRNVETYSGRVYLDGVELMGLGDEDFRQQVRWIRMSLVPQAAMNSLNPVLKVGDQVAEPMIAHRSAGRDEALHQAHRMFQYVGVPVGFVDRYPFELSGGMRQRVAIAMALVTAPSLVILDEPTSALDVLTQANIMNMLKRTKQQLGISYVLITHDIATSSELADRVAVMYAGQIVEVSDAERFFAGPLHPYSEALMASVPRLRGDREPEFIVGEPPSLLEVVSGCRFAPRCSSAHGRCERDPPLVVQDGHRVRCWLYG